MKTLLFILNLSIAFSQGLPEKTNHDKLKSIQRVDLITFGSSNHQSLPSLHWAEMKRLNPDLVLLLGDNVYNDFLSSKSLEKNYDKLNNNFLFKKLIEERPFIGIWDNRDYGSDDGYLYPLKNLSKKLFMNFFQIDPMHEMRDRVGIYSSYSIGSGNEKVKFILLDTQSFRNKLYMKEKDILGKEQWAWLEKELYYSDAKINFIVSSDSFFFRPSKTKDFDKWIDYPKSFKRLMDMIDRIKVPGVFFLSGDKRFSVIQKFDYQFKRYYEFLSSSLTHRGMVHGKSLKEVYGDDLYAGRNFGSIKISWFPIPALTLRIHSSNTGLVKVKKNYLLKDNNFIETTDGPLKN